MPSSLPKAQYNISNLESNYTSYFSKTVDCLGKEHLDEQCSLICNLSVHCDSLFSACNHVPSDR